MEEYVPVRPATAAPSLYQKVGGAKGIASIVDGVVEAHLQNPVIRARFLP